VATPVVVSNTTPLIALAHLARLDLLPTLFGAIHIPQAIYDEIQHNPDAIGIRFRLRELYHAARPF
jgi:predicted nucleic acid-binding protein